MLGFYDARSFETHIINNHNVTALISLIVLGNDSAQSFDTLPKTNHRVTAKSAQIVSGFDSLKFQHKNRTYRPGQKIPPHVKWYIFFKCIGKQPMPQSVTILMH